VFQLEVAMFDAKKLLDVLVSAGSQAAQGAQGAAGQSGGLGGMIGSVLGQIGQGATNAAQSAQGAAQSGGLGGLVGNVLGQLGQGATQAGTAAGGALDTVQGKLAGTQAGDLMARARELAANNPGTAGALLGGLGALVLGSKTGRSVLGSAAALGGLALIGGLAYKAYNDYQAGTPAGANPQPALAAPSGSGFEPEVASNDTAILFIRAMIAAAASDGQIDDAERQAIVGGLTEAGFDPAGNAWLEGEMANPASIDDLAAAAPTPEVAAQVYTAARLAIEPDTQDEVDFLASLGHALNLDATLISHIDMAAAGAKA
jgi:uncharacterized membrane protein YebE (DUF533 family)